MPDRTSLKLLLALGFTTALTACQKKDPEKCQQALATVRQGIAAGQFGTISEWRGYAYKNCEDQAELGKLDQEIVSQRTAQEKANAEKAALASETLNVAKAFVEFVGEHRQDPLKAAAMRCGTNEEKKDEVWCKGDRWLNRDRGYKYEVKVWKAEPAASYFRTRTIGEVGCQAFGGAKLVRKWGEPTKWWHCKLHDPATEGLHALIERTPKESRVEVFSSAYLARDEALAAKVGK